MKKFDVIIIGAGPGGYVTAIRSAQLGFKTCIIENKHLGGICLNWGCIPTKALLRSAEVYGMMQHAESYGLSATQISFDISKVVQRSRAISKQLNQGVGHLLKKNKVSVLMGTAKLNGSESVQVETEAAVTETLTAPNIIIATGARPRILPDLKLNNKFLWTYFEAMVPTKIPNSILVIGSGAIGIEFASFYNALGSNVTIVEILSQILPNEDTEISSIARKQMEKHGIKFITDTKVTQLYNENDGVKVELKGMNGQGNTIFVEKVISAIGVQGNIENIGLETTGIKTSNGCIHVNKYGLTDEPGIYAIGDVAGPPMLAHKAEHEGVVCVENIAGLEVQPIDTKKIPSCTYSIPQIASIGMSEDTAKKNGFTPRIGKFPFVGNGKAIALGEPEGLVKTIFDSNSGELLGAHLVGADVTELIHGFTIAIGLETTEKELMSTIFPHPTLSEMMHESVLNAYGRTIHF